MTDPKADAGWHPASWLDRTAGQIPVYRDQQRAEAVMAELARLPPLVTSWEVDALRDQLALAGEGKAFVLQGGDCAETFEDCRSDAIVTKLKILLQMSVVIISGLKRPVVRVGRMAGQYAKPRSADSSNETISMSPSGAVSSRSPRERTSSETHKARTPASGNARINCCGRSRP